MAEEFDRFPGYRWGLCLIVYFFISAPHGFTSCFYTCNFKCGCIYQFKLSAFLYEQHSNFNFCVAYICPCTYTNKYATTRISKRNSKPKCKTLDVGYLLKILKMASSAATVFPEPVGAPSRTFVSVWYKVWKIWVWTGLKCVNLYRASYSLCPKAVTGNGCRSNNSATENKSK